MLMSKYFTNAKISEGGRKYTCSKTWTTCKIGGPIFKSGLKWVVKNGVSTNLWINQLPFRPLRSIIYEPLTREEANLTVADIKDQGSNWYQNILSFELPNDMCRTIQAIHFSLDSNSEDSSCWAYSKDRSFSLQSIYMIVKGLNPLNLSIDSCEWIWKISTTPRIMFFIWLCQHNSVPICEVLGSRGFTLDSSCSICYQGIKSLIHILRECSSAKSFWSKLGIPTECKRSFVKITMIRIKLNSTSKALVDRYGFPWKVIFPMSIWHLWLHQNAFTFTIGTIEENFHIQCLKKATIFFTQRWRGRSDLRNN